ncbi:uncharacterized protein ZK1073.1-like isoform X2 [Mya arenaria]|uniref:uncharacterized protein ZK1073.1-like isoform X2 n=1 Tax=Mya arenaria TaxID=6604 RepID=UPI0022E1E297|nr:uncharacterized protein ZK1073.1-like isoform X2 [Mya arenaria]
MSGQSEEHREISAPRVSKFNVYIQGDLKHSHFTILTVHDLGCNHKSWEPFLQHESMVNITSRCAFIHVDIPGQEDSAPKLPADYTFPSMQSLGEDLVCVLDQLDVKNVVGLGEGAGANILARFAMVQPNRVLGVCLIHCTGTSAGFMESLKDKILGWKLEHIGMNPTAESYLVLHRFGSFENANDKEELNGVLQSYQEALRSKINPHNLNNFVQSFMKRSNITDSIQKIKCPVLMVTGDQASFNHTVHTLYSAMSQKMDKGKIELLEVEGVANVLEERPEKLAESFLYFCQGIGVVGGVPMPRVSRTSSMDAEAGRAAMRNRSMSMEEADQPKGIYSTSPTHVGSPPKANIAE